MTMRALIGTHTRLCLQIKDFGAPWRTRASVRAEASHGTAARRRSRVENNDGAAIADSFYASTRNATTFALAWPSQ